jgi:pimeloyl-ACP methyl ester carboxylesterase
MHRRTDKLDPREEHFRIPSHHAGLQLFLRYLPPTAGYRGKPKVVLYVHGATFPSALSIAHRFDGRSWRDELADAGCHVWGLDFHGYGGSDPHPGMAEAPDGRAPLGRAQDAAEQIARAARFIAEHHGLPALSIIAHSWGTVATGLFATRYPELVDRLVFFGPITQRQNTASPPAVPAWAPITAEAQWKRFIEDVPPGEPPVLLRRHFDAWVSLYLATDPASRSRQPAAVAVPAGPMADITAAWHGALAYDPGLIKAPVCIIRGEWDGLCQDDDARWLWNALSRTPEKRDIKIGRATHLMHLEAARYALYREALAFIDAEDRAVANSEYHVASQLAGVS